MSAGITDSAIVAAYIVVLLWIGYRARTRGQGADEYLLAGRRLTLPAFVMTLVTTWYGGILGVGEYTYSYGIASWFVFGLPYYVAAMLFALFFAARARRSRFRNLPDQLYQAYGPAAGRAGAVVIFLVTLPAGYVLMLGVLASIIFGVDVRLGIVVGTLISVGYVYVGGFNSVVRTDRLQFVLMFGGFVVLLAAVWYQLGSPAHIWAQLPPDLRQPTGGQSIWAILVWYFIALATLIEPTFYQRCYAARDERTARRGLFVSVGFWLVFDLLTTVIGLYAVVAYPGLADPVQSFPLLAADYLPVGLRGLFWAALLAVIMSTVDSFTFIAAVTAGRDVVLGRTGRTADAAEWRAARLALPLVAALSVLLAIQFRSVVDIWYVFGTVATPALLLPVLTSFWPEARFRPRAALLNILAAGGVSLAWEWLRRLYSPSAFPLVVPAIYIGLAVSIGIWLGDRLLGTRMARAWETPDGPR